MQQRGMRSGEFREVPIEAATHMLIAPMLHLALHEHSFGELDNCAPSMTPIELLEAQMSLLLHGLMNRPPAP